MKGIHELDAQDDLDVVVDVGFFPETLKLPGTPGKRESLNFLWIWVLQV